MRRTASLSSFESMLGRAATERERDQLRRVQAELGLRENDALWLVIFALQYYEGLYRQFPKAIAAGSATRSLGNAGDRRGDNSSGRGIGESGLGESDRDDGPRRGPRRREAANDSMARRRDARRRVSL